MSPKYEGRKAVPNFQFFWIFCLVKGWKFSFFGDFFFGEGLFPQGWKTISPYNIKSFPLGLLMK